jgi:hypothetical protein
VINGVANGPEGVRKYQVLNAPRPWWISQVYLTPDQRPVPLLETALLLAAGAALGLGLMVLAGWRLGADARDRMPSLPPLPARLVAYAGQESH